MKKRLSISLALAPASSRILVRAIRAGALIGIFAAMAGGRALAQATLGAGNGVNLNPAPLQVQAGPITWTMNTYAPQLVNLPQTYAQLAASNYVAAFNAWNVADNYNLAFTPNTNIALTVSAFTPKLSALGRGDLTMEITLSYPNKPAVGPPLIGKEAGQNDAVWSQAVSTNDAVDARIGMAMTPTPRAGGGLTSYLDLSFKKGRFPPPAYPNQYTGSQFWDKPGRYGVINETVYWFGDAVLTTITPPIYNDLGRRTTRGTVNVYADVSWGFSLTGVWPNQNPGQFLGLGTDIGHIPAGIQAVPEPRPEMVLGLGVLAAGLIRRKKRP